MRSSPSASRGSSIASLARPELARQFGVHSLEGFGIGPGDVLAVGAAGALLRYLHELQPSGVPHLARPIVERAGVTMPLDEMTRRNLELVESMRGGDVAGTLLGVLDRTITPMGARLLRQWILAPLVDRSAIDQRLDAVAALARDLIARQALRDALDGVRDIERLAGKAAAGRATPREVGGAGRIARSPPGSRSCAATDWFAWRVAGHPLDVGRLRGPRGGCHPHAGRAAPGDDRR